MMGTNEIVAKFVDDIGSIWGRDLSKGAALAYMAVAKPYSPKQAQAACDQVLQGAQFMPTPATLGDALRAQNRASVRPYELPANIERAGADIAKKAVDEFLRRTGQRRGRK